MRSSGLVRLPFPIFLLAGLLTILSFTGIELADGPVTDDPSSDLVVLPVKPVPLVIATGKSEVTKRVRVRVANAEAAAWTARLIATDGDCPSGTVVRAPDFDTRAVGAQDAVLLGGGKVRSATIELRATSDGVLSLGRKAPHRCRLRLRVEPSPVATDVSPTNDVTDIELDVVDRNDPQQPTAHEALVRSAKPVTIDIAKSKAMATKPIRVVVGNADHTGADPITLAASDGDCPTGTVGRADFEARTPGTQDGALVAGGKTAAAKLVVSVDAARFATFRAGSPARCVALLTATGPAGMADPDPSNDVTRLVIDVVDKNDVGLPTPTPTTVATPTPTPVVTPTPSPTPTATATPVPTGGLPPEPATVAPALDPTIASNIFRATEFLYTGANPIQTGVSAGAIDPVRAAVVRGRVLDASGAALPGATVALLGQPDLGQTLSRASGGFDLVVNGGGPLTVTIEKAGFLPVQRTLDVPWQEYALLPDVVLVPTDAQASAIDLLSTEPFQVAHGSVQSDTRGTRRATLLFAQGTQGDLVLPDGTTQPVTELHVRLTEYTVGDDGPAAMPAELPPTSGYTYAVELGADEITAAGATTAQFSQPVLFYLENFIGMPAGVQVPMAFYDRTRAAWVPTLDGKVVAILAVAPGGDAELDTDGDGLADDGSALSPPVTAAERAQLGSLYAAGQSLWRVPVSHFTSYDPNYGVVPGAGAQDPSQPMPVQASYPKLDQSSQQDGYGVIDIQNQSFRETLPVVGTPYLLAYASDRMSGYTAANTVRIAVSGATLPSGIKRIDLTIEVAGRRIVQSYSPATGLTYDFVWDGTDAYGRAVRGEQTAQIRIDYVYDGFYALPPALAETFGFPSGVKVPGDVPSRTDAARSQRFRVKLGRSPARDFGGWSLSPQHVYDPIGETIYLGDGRRRSARDLNASVLSRVAGTGDAGDAGDGGAARSAQLNGPRDVAVSPDGALYVADTDNHRIRRVARDGTITTVAGTGSPGSAGDGGPAVSAQLAYPSSVAIGPDGSVYVAVLDGARIRRVARDGVITTAVGTGTPGFSGDGGPATQANIGESVLGLAVAPDDTLFLTDGNRVRRVSPSGTIATVAGTGVAGFSGDGGPATSAKLSSPTDIALGRDGSLYVVDRDNLVVRRVGPDGVITTVAGVAPPVTVSSGGLDWLAQAPRAAELVARIARGARDLAAEGVALASGVVGGDGDGGPATDAHLNVPSGIAVAPDGTIFISEDDRVRAVAADGVIRTIAGSGSTLSDDMPAAQAYLDSPGGLAVAPDGSLYLADPYRDFYVAPPGSANVVRRVAGVLPGFTAGQIAIAAESGSELYQFDANGRHLRTVHALTGATQQEFGYDAAGRLTSVRDANDNLTTIERDGDGRPLSIVGPYGQRTTLSLDANDHLAALTTPGLLTTQLVHDAGGLLTAITSARGNTYTVAYDAQGRVAQVVDPAGGSSTLASMATAAGRSVVQTTALGRMASFLVEDLSTGVLHQSSSAWDGTITETATGRDGRTTRAAADGSTASRLAGTDPQYGLQPSLAAATQIKTPGGATLSAAAEHTAIFTVPGDPSSLGSLTDTIRLNDRTFVRNVDAATRTITLTSPTGRQTITTIDSQGRPVVLARSGLATTTVAYDAMGRIGSVTQGGGAGARTQTFGYGTDGLLASFVDPIGRTFLFDRDADGRLTSLTRPDTTTVGFGFDHEGNTSAIYAPGGAVHGFEHSQVNLPTSYVPPIVGGVPQPMLLAYDLDRQLATISRADGGVLEQEYEPLTGRLHTSTSPDRQVTYSYDGATGKPTRIAASDGPVLDYLHDGFLPTSEAWSGPVVGEVQRTHDDDLRRSAITVAGTAPVAFGYDEDGLVIAAGPLTLDRDPRSGLVTDTTVGGATTTLTHDAFGAVVGATAEFAGSPLYAAVLTRDQLGRVTDVTETISGVTHVSHYAYDPVGRLIDAQRDAATTTYGYDANGNRVSASDTGATGVYDAQDRVLSYGPTTYVHSAAGDRSSKTSAMQTTTYTYDVRGNLRTVSLPDGRQIDYVVDGRNRRIGRTVDGALVEGLLYLDALRPIATLDATSSVVSVFVYAGAESVPAVILRGGSTYRIVTDHTGSPRLVVDVATGAVVQRLDYDAFGRVTLDTNPGFQPFGFAGGLYDPDTGLVRFGQRDYDADVGRWTTKDPAGFAGGDTNLYAYVGNDPINGSDPTGTGPTWQQKSYKVLKDLYGSFSKANREMNAQLHTLTFTTVVIGSMLLPPSRSNLKSLYLAKNSVVVGETVAEEAAIGGLQPYAKSGYDVINFSIETAEELGVQQEILQATGSSAEGIVPAAVEDIGTLLRGLYK